MHTYIHTYTYICTHTYNTLHTGVRPAMRPAVWQLIVSHYADRHKKKVIGVTTVEEYKKLSTAKTDYCHAISIDLGEYCGVIVTVAN